MIQFKKLLGAMLLVFTTFLATSQNKSADKEEAIFSFDDGVTTYTMYKITPTKTPSAYEAPYSKKVVPAFKLKIKVLDEPIIDTIRDFEDPSIILAIDTLIGQEFIYAKKFSYSYEILSQELQKILYMAKDQGFDVIQTKFIIFWEEGVYAQFGLPSAEDLEGTTKVCLTIRLRKNGLSMEYPVLFAH